MNPHLVQVFRRCLLRGHPSKIQNLAPNFCWKDCWIAVGLVKCFTGRILADHAVIPVIVLVTVRNMQDQSNHRNQRGHVLPENWHLALRNETRGECSDVEARPKHPLRQGFPLDPSVSSTISRAAAPCCRKIGGPDDAAPPERSPEDRWPTVLRRGSMRERKANVHGSRTGAQRPRLPAFGRGNPSACGSLSRGHKAWSCTTGPKKTSE